MTSAPWLLILLDLLMVVASLIWLILSCLPSSTSWAITPPEPSPLTEPRDAPFPFSVPILPLLAILFVVSTLLVIFYLITYIIRFIRHGWDGWEEERHGMVHAIHTKYIQYQHSLTCECILSWTLLIITLGWLLTSGVAIFLLLFILNDIDDMPHDDYNTHTLQELYKMVLHTTYYHITTLSLGISWCLVHIMYSAYRLRGLHTDMDFNKERYDFLLRQHLVEPVPVALAATLLHSSSSTCSKSGVSHDCIMSLPSFQYHENKQSAVLTPASASASASASRIAKASKHTASTKFPSHHIHISIPPSSLTPHQWHCQKHDFPITDDHDACVEAKDEIPPSPASIPSSSSSSSSPSCCICLSTFISGELLSYLPCHHFMHSACIQQWLMQQNSCPICRQLVVSIDPSS